MPPCTSSILSVTFQPSGDRAKRRTVVFTGLKTRGMPRRANGSVVVLIAMSGPLVFWYSARIAALASPVKLKPPSASSGGTDLRSVPTPGPSRPS